MRALPERQSHDSGYPPLGGFGEEFLLKKMNVPILLRTGVVFDKETNTGFEGLLNRLAERGSGRLL